MDILDIAKAFNRTGEAFGLDQSHFHAEIEKRAAAIPGDLSSYQKYARVVETPEGRELLKAATSAGRRVTQAAQDVAPEQKSFGPAGKLLNELASDLARSKSLTLQESYSRLITDPARSDLVRRVREEEKRATDAVYAQRWPLRNAERSSENWRLGHTAGSRRM
jgi:hypothetical protein